MNIPPKLDVSDIELSEEELELVSGGDIFFGVWAAVMLFTAGAILGDSAAHMNCEH